MLGMHRRGAGDTVYIAKYIERYRIRINAPVACCHQDVRRYVVERAMKVSDVRITPIAFRDAPVLNASGIHEPYALRTILEVECDNGMVGLGETYGDAAVLSAVRAVAPALAGMSPYDLNSMEAQIRQILTALPAAQAGTELAPGSHPSKQVPNCFSAFEVAFLDLQAKAAGVPLHQLLGGAVRREVPFSAYLFFKYARHIDADYADDPWGEALDPEGIVRQATRMINLYGFESIKLKAGALHPDIECATIRALAQAFPGLPLRIDPNAAWSMETAVRVAGELAGLLQYYEDPVAGLGPMAELHRATGLPLATNMVVTDFDELRQSIAQNAVQIVLSDHHYWGGMRRTQTLAAICDHFGLGLSMHSNSHLGISLMAMAHVAAATPKLSYACDTHYPWVEDDDEVVMGGKVKIEGGCVRVGDEPGLGVSIDRARLERLNGIFERIAIRSRDDVAQMRKYDPAFDPGKPRF
ncbi:glucarate dehydratase family protein [Sphingobium sp. B8D3B]|nr:glucarate dehydratase family protein [Sphingobium sp. B8D3B]MCW2395745.1 glucarate dehydratase [Sphingobium sp. B8D3B]MCW2419260.1 glucarate dehydratase [Sphingobium sp. B8D3C]